MKAKINTTIMFDFSCANENIDEYYFQNSNEEWAEMLKKELEKYIREEIVDRDLTISNIKTEIEYLEDVPKENK